MNQPCQKLVVLIFALVAAPAFGEGLSVAAYAYDARVAWLNAGELSLNVNRNREYYEFAGAFETSREMSAYYKWNGRFAGVGRWDQTGPRSEAYLAQSKSKDRDLKIVVMSLNGVRLLEEADGQFETLERPQGNDLISALFFTPTCYAGGFVHDGEDQYSISLVRQKDRELKGKSKYYSGAVTECEYEVVDKKDRKRRVVVSLADIEGTTVAVQVRAKIPIWPDPVFRLKLPPTVGREQVAGPAVTDAPAS